MTSTRWTLQIQWCVWLFGGWYARKHGHGGLQIGPLSLTYQRPLLREDE